MHSINTISNNQNIETVKELSSLSNQILQILLSSGNPVDALVHRYELYGDKTAFVAALVGVLVLRDRQARMKPNSTEKSPSGEGREKISAKN